MSEGVNNINDADFETEVLQAEKPVLVYFWASWCGPCLLQVPDLKEAQAAYGEKGFQIFSVSADTKEKKWKEAIVEYDLNWPNVSDLEGWNSEAAKVTM